MSLPMIISNSCYNPMLGLQMEQLVAHVPWMLTNGNHERDFPGSGDRYNANDNIDSGALLHLEP